MVYELVGPVFLGTFLAIVTVLALMGKLAKLFAGPRMLMGAGYKRCHGCGMSRRSCMCHAGSHGPYKPSYKSQPVKQPVKQHVNQHVKQHVKQHVPKHERRHTCAHAVGPPEPSAFRSDSALASF